MKILPSLLLALCIVGLFVLDWMLNDGGVLIFVGRKLLSFSEVLAVWR